MREKETLLRKRLPKPERKVVVCVGKRNRRWGRVVWAVDGVRRFAAEAASHKGGYEAAVGASLAGEGFSWGGEKNSPAGRLLQGK